MLISSGITVLKLTDGDARPWQPRSVPDDTPIDVLSAQTGPGLRDTLETQPVDCVLCEASQFGSGGGVETAVEDVNPSIPVVVYPEPGGPPPVDALEAGADELLPGAPSAVDDVVVATRLDAVVSRASAEIERDHIERRYHQLVDTAPVPIGVTTPEDGMVYVNEATLDLVDAESAEEILGRSTLAFVHEDDRSRSRQRFRRVMEDRVVADPTELKLVTLDGDVRHAVVAMAPVTYERRPAAQFILNDVTEYRRAQTQLEEHQRFVDNVLDALDDVLCVYDESGDLVLWNQQLVETTGYTDEEVAESDVTEFVPAGETEALDAMFADFDRVADGTFDLDIVTKTGERIPHEFRAVTVEEEQTGRTLRVGIGRDVTDRRRREEELRRKNERLEAFASSVSHDLRNPLEAITGCLELARAVDEPGEYLEEAERTVDRAQQMIDDVLALAREGETVLDRETVSVPEMTSAVVDDCAGDVSVKIDPDLGTLGGDPRRFRRLLENLVENAVQHNEGPVTVWIGRLEDGDGFYVADDGDGFSIDPDRVFEPALTDDEDGTGFGLAIVDEIAEAHGWSITATESRHGGARFEVSGVNSIDAA